MADAQVLVLNRLYQPINVTSVRRALVLLYVGVARAINRQYQLFDFSDWAELRANYGDETIGTVGRAILVPRVIVLQVYDRVPMGRIRFSRHNVFLRDQFTCQYCGQMLPRRQLNLDHVIPRSRGGKSNWHNVVTSCVPCNFEKGGRTPGEAGMQLVRPAKKPSWTDLVYPMRLRARYQEWLPFLDPLDASYWNTELESD